MASVSAEAAKAADAAVQPAVKKPPPLTPMEQIFATVLLVAGAAVIAFTLFALSGADSDLVFKGKEKTVVSVKAARGKPGGGGGSSPPARPSCGKKKARAQRKACREKRRRHARQRRWRERERRRLARATRRVDVAHEVDFSDSLAAAALGVGLALALSGGLYGRIRSLKAAGVEAKFVDPETENTAREAAAQSVEEKIAQTSVEDEKTMAVAQAAAQAATVAEVNRVAAYGIEPTEGMIQGIADRTAAKVTDELT